MVWEIDDEGHRECSKPPVLFRQDPNAQPLPRPVEGGSLEDLKKFVSLKTNKDFRLYAADIVMAVAFDEVGESRK